MSIVLQDQAQMYGALFVLRQLARKYEFRDEDESAPMNAIVGAALPLLLPVFQVIQHARVL